jgi:phosphate transport system protein
MSGKFHRELDRQKARVLEMGVLARDMLCQSVDALVKLDAELAETIRERKEDIREFDYTIERETLQLIALFQPMAVDMRTIACILKLITYLARIGRYGKEICDLTRDLANQTHVKKLVSIPYMRQIVCSMIDDALEAFEKGDISKLGDFPDRDDIVDELDESIFRECFTYMVEDSKTITRCVRYIMIARYLERCGDHACKMAEKIHYMVTGEHIEVK